MCKVFLTAGIKDSTRDKAWKFAKEIGKRMGKHNNNDGIGYAAITEQGSLFGERWLVNSTAFQEPSNKDAEGSIKEFEEVVVGAIKEDTFEYNSFGVVERDKLVALTLHTRMATSPKGMVNTHPFVDQGVSLIHNGMISNHSDFELKLSTCDSEAILQAYINHDVKSDTMNMTAAAASLVGYYVCGVLTNTTTGPVLDFFKANHARLSMAYVNELETYVLSTDENDIKETCKELGYTMSNTYTILEGKIVRVNAITGKIISKNAFEVSKSYVHKEYSYPSYPIQNRTSMMNGKTIGDTTVTKAKLYPFDKHKKNTDIAPDLMEYFKAGVQSCVKLTDREVQEEIFFQEQFFGRA